MQTQEAEQEQNVEQPLTQEEPSSPFTPSVVDRLAAYSILPPGHESMDARVLALVEQLFFTWYELGDDTSRRAAIPYLFPTDAELRQTLLALVPLYFDASFFDDKTPTRDLVAVALVAHAKWRRWLDGSRC